MLSRRTGEGENNTSRTRPGRPPTHKPGHSRLRRRPLSLTESEHVSPRALAEHHTPAVTKTTSLHGEASQVPRRPLTDNSHVIAVMERREQSHVIVSLPSKQDTSNADAAKTMPTPTPSPRITEQNKPNRRMLENRREIMPNVHHNTTIPSIPSKEKKARKATTPNVHSHTHTQHPRGTPDVKHHHVRSPRSPASPTRLVRV